MPFGLFEEFGDFGFGEDPSSAEGFYDTLVEMLGDAFDMTPGTYEEARAYSTALLYSEAKSALERARNQLQPSTVSDKLEDMERDYKVTPNPGDSEDTRRARLVALKMLMRGPRLEAIMNALIADLGADFLALRFTKAAEVQTWPADPSTVGTFPKLSTPPKFYKLLGPVLDNAAPQAVEIQAINNSTAPLAGEKLTVEPEITGIAEAITVESVTVVASDKWTITPAAAFKYAHSPGACVVTATPLWHSTQRQVVVVLTDAAAVNPEKRRLANRIMARHSKASTQWYLVAASSSTQIGPFLVGTGRVGIDAIGTSTFP